MNIEDQINQYFKTAENEFKTIIDNFKMQLTSIQTSNVTTNIFHKIIVDYYNVMTPLMQTASVNAIGESRFSIHPYDLSCKKSILVALHKSNLDIIITEDKTTIYVQFEKLSTEIRQKRVAEVKTVLENFKIQVRNQRRDFLHQIEKNNNTSRNLITLEKERIQKALDISIKKLELIADEKINLLTKV